MDGEKTYIDGLNGGKLTPFPKGWAGGPGRPKGGKNLTKQRIARLFNTQTEVFNELTGQTEMITIQEQMLMKLAKQAIQDGCVHSASFLHDRYEGKPTQHLGSDPDAPLVPNNFENFTPEQLREMMAAAPPDIEIVPEGRQQSGDIQDAEWEAV